jgi:hypothetical protein
MTRTKLAVSTVAALALSLLTSAVVFADGLGPWMPK